MSVSSDLAARIMQLQLIGSPERPIATIPPADIAQEIEDILTEDKLERLSTEQIAAVLSHVLAVYAQTWHASGRALIPAIERGSHRVFSDPQASLDALCLAYDLLYFFYWCWNTSLDQQVRLGKTAVVPFAAAVGRRIPKSDLPRRPASQRVGYLAEFITQSPGNAIADANRGVLNALAAAFPSSPPILYAWMFHDPASLATLASQGVEVRAISANSMTERIAKTRELIEADRPDVLITDMNASLPTVIFAARSAPIQIFYQFGMPVWPLKQVDAIFHVWSFNFAKAGLSGRRHWELIWIPREDLRRFTRPADKDLVDIERRNLGIAPGRCLVGNYGRLSKITPPFIEAVADAISDRPEVTVLFGGTGDAQPIRNKIASLGMSDHFIIAERYVDGHVWGDLLDIFLDTFPLPGGASCREMVMKGKPVVGLVTSDAANLAHKRKVPCLVAEVPSAYSKIVARLLSDRNFFDSSCRLTRQLAASFCEAEKNYPSEIADAIDCLRKERLLPKWRRIFRSKVFNMHFS